MIFFQRQIAMKVTVGVLDGAFLNEQRFNHAGIVLCYKEKDGTPTVMVPGNPKKGVKTIHLDFVDGTPGIEESPEGHRRIKINVKSCRFFIFADSTFGFVYKEGGKMKLFSLFLALVSHLDAEGPEVAFRKFFSGLELRRKNIFDTGSSKKLKSFLVMQGCGSTELKNYWEEHYHVVYKKSKDFDWNGLHYYSEYLQPYAKFTNKKPMSEKEFKKFMRGVDNFPKFVRETLGWTRTLNLYHVTASFMEAHICAQRDCGGFSFIACSNCKIAHYCNKECQEEDFNEHKQVCVSMKEIASLRQNNPTILSNICKEQSEPKEEIVSMQVFTSELMKKLYSFFHKELKRGSKSIHAKLIYLMMYNTHHNDYYDSMDPAKMGGLLGSSHQTENFDVFFKQMEKYLKRNDENNAKVPLQKYLEDTFVRMKASSVNNKLIAIGSETFGFDMSMNCCITEQF